MLYFLNEHGIQASIHYPVPPHLQKAYRGLPHPYLPITEKMHREVLSLPISQIITDEEAATVVHFVNSFHSDN